MGKTVVIELAKELDGKKPYMGIVSIDSYGDVLIRDINFETTLDPADTFSLCNTCGLPVVDSSIVPGTDDGNGFGQCDHCNNKLVLPDTSVMSMIIMDCYGDKKAISPLFADTSLVAADYMMPCAHCGVAVLLESIPENMDTCKRCNVEHKVPELSDEAMLNMVRTQTLPEDVMLAKEGFKSVEERIAAATYMAADQFWKTIADLFPECKTGDLEPNYVFKMEETMQEIVTHWVELNKPSVVNRPKGDVLDDLFLHYKDTWHLHHTGGGCMVAATDNVAVNMHHNYLAISSECVCVYTDDFSGECFLMEPITIWAFGDNPTVLMNQLDEHMGGIGYWDTGKLFDDIMTIGKSNRVQ